MLNKGKWLSLLTAGVIFSGLAIYYTGEQQPEWVFDTERVEIGNIEATVATAGTLEAVGTVIVGAEISGRINSILADFNSEVTEGQLIALLDDRSPLAVVKQAEANLALSRAAVQKSQASLEEAKVNHALQQNETLRVSTLAEKGHATESEIDRARSQEDITRVRITLAEAELRRTEAELIKQQAVLDEARLDLERTRIHSPVNGVVLERKVEQGQTVNANQTTPELFIIAEDMRQMQIEADVDEADIGQVKEGQQVRFTVDSYPKRTFTGVVDQVRLAAREEASVVTYTAIISVDNSGLSLFPGMTSTVDIITGQKSEVVRIPNSALRFTAPKTLATEIQPVKNQLPDELFNTPEEKQQVEKLLGQMRQSATGRNSTDRSGEPGSQGQGMPPAMQKLRTELTEMLGTERAGALFKQMRRRRGGSEIWVLREGQPQRLNVRTGLSDERYTEVFSKDLEAGDQVIISARQEQG